MAELLTLLCLTFFAAPFAERPPPQAAQFILRNSDTKLGYAIHLTKLGYETRIRNSDTKLDVGFWWDLSFVTHPSFVSGAIHHFGNGKRNYFFFEFRKRNSDTKLKSRN